MSIASEITRLQSAKASVKSAIEAKGVTVPPTSKLDDYAEYISEISGGGGGSAQIATGTFTGSGNVDQQINIGFEPDIVVANCSALDLETAGWTGQKNVIIVKNMVTYQARHNNSTTASAQTSVSDDIGGDYPAYGKTDGYYQAYGAYSDGIFTISNGTRNAMNSFVNGYTYDWIAIKYSE